MAPLDLGEAAGRGLAAAGLEAQALVKRARGREVVLCRRGGERFYLKAALDPVAAGKLDRESVCHRVLAAKPAAPVVPWVAAGPGFLVTAAAGGRVFPVPEAATAFPGKTARELARALLAWQAAGADLPAGLALPGPGLGKLLGGLSWRAWRRGVGRVIGRGTLCRLGAAIGGNALRLGRWRVLAHHDLTEVNLLLDEAGPTARFLDLEAAGRGPALYDGLHLCSHAPLDLKAWGWQGEFFRQYLAGARSGALTGCAPATVARLIRATLIVIQLKLLTFALRRGSGPEVVEQRRANLAFLAKRRPALDWAAAWL